MARPQPPARTMEFRHGEDDRDGTAPAEKIMPREPTLVMLRAAELVQPSITINDENYYLRLYRAMFDAAPE
jgi:hypothetical protein